MSSLVLFDHPIGNLPTSNRPNSLEIEVTNRCNLICKHCYTMASPQYTTDVLTKEVIQNIINDFTDSGGSRIAISGGEPLARKACLELIEYSALQLPTQLSTNGTMLNDEAADALSSIKNLIITISLDGVTPATNDSVRGAGSFEQIMKGIEMLIHRNMGNRLHLSMVVMRHNIKEVPQMIKLADALGIEFVHFPPVSNMGRAKMNWHTLSPYEDQYDWLLERLDSDPLLKYQAEQNSSLYPIILERWLKRPKKFNGCPFGARIRIDYLGNVFPCVMFTDKSFSLGNICEKRLLNILKLSHNRIEKLKSDSLLRPQVIEECESCKWNRFCNSGCMGRAFASNGTIWSPDDICDVNRRLFEGIATKRGYTFDR